MRPAPTTRRAGKATAALAIAAVLALGCAGPAVVDGIRLGATSSCDGLGCADYEAAGRAWLDAAAPGHPAVVNVEVREIPVLDASGRPALSTQAGRATRAVELRLGDGSVRATAVSCGVPPGSCSAVTPPTAPSLP